MTNKILEFDNAVNLAKKFLITHGSASFKSDDLRRFYADLGYVKYNKCRDLGDVSIEYVSLRPIMRELHELGLTERLSARYWRILQSV